MPPKHLNEIPLHAVPNVWEKQADLQGWDFEGNSYKEKCEMFECMDIADKVYKGGTLYKTTIREDANSATHDRKRKGGEIFSPTKPEKGCAGKRR